MAKKIVKKKKLKIVPFLIVLLILIGLSFSVYQVLKANIKNIVIKNASYLNDDYVIDLAGIKDYPSFYLTSSIKMEKNLKKSPYIISAKVKRKFYHVLEIDLKVNNPLFINNSSNTVVFENKGTVPIDEEIDLFRVPRLMNYVPDDKYDTFIEQGGTNVSGGQKQRLCIARALLRKPKILILDDSTSAVDTTTEAKIQKAIKEYMPNTTKIIIAQRILSVKDADKIIVIDNGMINGIGNHQQLLATNQIYKEIYYSQQDGMNNI